MDILCVSKIKMWLCPKNLCISNIFEEKIISLIYFFFYYYLGYLNYRTVVNYYRINILRVSKYYTKKLKQSCLSHKLLNMSNINRIQVCNIIEYRCFYCIEAKSLKKKKLAIFILPKLKMHPKFFFLMYFALIKTQ